MMAVRLMDMLRVLKPTGSIYLHCNPTASHYLKLLVVAVFGSAQFRSELIPFLCDAAVFTLGGLMDSRFRGNDGWEPCCI